MYLVYLPSLIGNLPNINESQRFLETAPADVIHAVSKFHVTNEPRHLYFFREGSVVGWNVSDLEVSSLINFVAEHEIGSYDDHIVMDERESMYYAYTNDK